MAINPSTNVTMSGRVTAPDANYPYASAKDETAPGAGDGTPYFKARADDLFGMQQALLRAAGITPSGNADTALASEYFQALVELASGRAFTYDDSGAADVYVLDVRANQQAPAGLFDGLVAEFIAGNPNTGASTVNVAGLSVKNIKTSAGADPVAGDITGRTALRYALGSDWFELVSSQVDARFQNALINGDGIITQRELGSTVDGDYSFDRWAVLSDGDGIVTTSQETSDLPVGTRSAMKLLVATANKKFGLLQIVAGKDCKNLIDGVASSSAKAKASGIANLRVAILSWNGTEDLPTLDVVSAWNAAGTDPTLVSNWTYENTPVNISLSTSWAETYQALNVSIDTASTKQVAAFIWIDDTDASVSDYLLLTDNQLEPGATVTDFNYRPYGEEFSLCQFRYQKSYDQDVFAGAADTNTPNNGVAPTTSLAEGFCLNSTMSSPPTIVLYSVLGTVNKISIFTGSTDAGNTVTASGISENGAAFIDDSATGFVAGTIHRWHWTADAELGI